MSAKEGPNAARRKLEAAGADPNARTGSIPVAMTSPGMPAVPRPAAGLAGGLAGILRRIFGGRGEAR
jgi:hypothetical protein